MQNPLIATLIRIKRNDCDKNRKAMNENEYFYTTDGFETVTVLKSELISVPFS